MGVPLRFIVWGSWQSLQSTLCGACSAMFTGLLVSWGKVLLSAIATLGPCTAPTPAGTPLWEMMQVSETFSFASRYGPLGAVWVWWQSLHWLCWLMSLVVLAVAMV